MLLTGTMSLMIVAVVMVIFVFAAANDARQAELRNLSRMSEVARAPVRALIQAWPPRSEHTRLWNEPFPTSPRGMRGSI